MIWILFYLVPVQSDVRIDPVDAHEEGPDAKGPAEDYLVECVEAELHSAHWNHDGACEYNEKSKSFDNPIRARTCLVGCF